MNRICDLHTHSRYSDGTASPREIVTQAASLGLAAVALTDHNTVAGLPVFMQAAAAQGVRAIPGVEISTGYDGRELHIVGLFVTPETYDRITDFLSVINIRKEASNRRLIDALAGVGFPLDYEAIRKQHKGNINRAVIAAEMLEKGYISEINAAFKGVLSARNGVYVPPERIPAFEAIAFLRSIGAVPVLAHPYLNMTQEKLEVFLPEARSDRHGDPLQHLYTRNHRSGHPHGSKVRPVGKRRQRLSWRKQAGYCAGQRTGQLMCAGRPDRSAGAQPIKILKLCGNTGLFLFNFL